MHKAEIARCGGKGKPRANCMLPTRNILNIKAQTEDGGK